MSDQELNRNQGVQPLDTILCERSLRNADLVAVSKEHLTHKMVQRGRKGRMLTRNVQQKILTALNVLCEDCVYTLKDLFSYRGL